MYIDTTYPSNNKVIGTCSLCGGAVCVPYMWHAVVPPTPTCSSCGATKTNPHGPVIPMTPKKEINTSKTDSSKQSLFDFYKIKTSIAPTKMHGPSDWPITDNTENI